MNNPTYNLSLTTGLWFHAQPHTYMLQDGETHDDHHELKAQVRSGYYFLTLATALDAIAQKLPASQRGSTLLLDKFIQDLEYLHEHYAIIKNSQKH